MVPDQESVYRRGESIISRPEIYIIVEICYQILCLDVVVSSESPTTFSIMQDFDGGARRGAEGDADPAGAGARADVVPPRRGGPGAGVEAADLRGDRGRAGRARRRGGRLRRAGGDDRRGGGPAAGDAGGAADGDGVRDVGDRAVGAGGAGGAGRRRGAADAGPELHVGEARRRHRQGREGHRRRGVRGGQGAREEEPRRHRPAGGRAHGEGDARRRRVQGDLVGARRHRQGAAGNGGEGRAAGHCLKLQSRAAVVVVHRSVEIFT